MKLNSRDQIIRMVDLFYAKVKADELLAPVFAHVDWPHHLPVMYNFWCSMILGEMSYRGNPFEKHVHLSLTSAHFDRWLKLFYENMDEHFTGEEALEAKNRAANIASVWRFKMNLS